MEEVFRRKPYLQFLRGKSSPDLSFTTARDGSRIPAENGRPLCSAYGPEKEAERILSGAQGLKRTQILVILGAGNPELFAAHRMLLPGQICVVLDHRLALGGLYIDLSIEEIQSSGIAPIMGTEGGANHPGQSETRSGKERADGDRHSALVEYLKTPGCHLFFGEETLISLEHYLEG
ncbi:MAG: hypothetical protein KDK25_09810, partial [Leptospiraceae bacterium]|nr:hypothetical protein [Leptospiraceae bacterium]